MNTIGQPNPGVYRTWIIGAGLDNAQSADLLHEQALLLDLAQAMEAAITTARRQGLAAFSPERSDLLKLPAGLGDDRRDALFQQLFGVSYLPQPGDSAQDREIGLVQWSDAALELGRLAAQARSRLAPGQGGGITYADGAWFVNGVRYSLQELTLAVRVGSYTSVDFFLQEALNRANTNAMTARKLLALLSDMNRSFSTSGKSASYSIQSQYKALVEKQGWTLDQLADWGAKVALSSYAQSTRDSHLADANASLSGENYGNLIAEVKAIFDATNAENQVGQLRLDGVINVRDNVVSGLGSFLKGELNSRATVARNLGAGS